LRLKKLYSSREVAALTGLSARQLQWWHARRLFVPSIPPQKTDAGGYTERRYTPVELLELMVLAELRRRKFSIPTIRRLLDTLRTGFKVRLFEAIEGGGPVTLFIDGRQIFARTSGGDIYNVLDHPEQPLLMVGEELKLRQLVARETSRRRRSARPPGRPPAATARSRQGSPDNRRPAERARRGHEGHEKREGHGGHEEQ
jgi:DNA-binding transcriptional MerR regulator